MSAPPPTSLLRHQLQANAAPPAPARRPILFPLLLIAAGVAVSAVAWWVIRLDQLHLIQSRFELEARERVLTVERELEVDMGALEALRAFYAGSQSVERDEFRAFCEVLLRRYRGLRALEWVPRVEPEQRVAFLDRVRRDGAPGFEILDIGENGQDRRPAAEGKVCYPIVYVEPQKENAAVLGVNFNFEANRRATLEAARDEGRIIVSGLIRLLQDKDASPAFVAVQPVYRNGAPAATLEQRRENLVGFLVGVFEFESSFEQALEPLSIVGVDLKLFEGAQDAPGQLLFERLSRKQTPRSSTPAPEGLEFWSAFEVPGRKWVIRASPSPAYAVEVKPWLPWVALLTGLVLTGLVAGLLESQLTRAREIEAQVQERSRELRRVNADLQAVLDSPTYTCITATDAQGRFTFWNKGGERLFGYAASELVGKESLLKLFAPAELSARSKDLSGRMKRSVEGLEVLTLLAETGVVDEREWTFVRKDGRACHVNLAISAIFGESGELTGYLGVARDVTRQKLAEEALRESERRLAMAMEGARLASFDADAISRKVNSTHGLGRMLGYAHDDIFPDFDAWAAGTHPDDYPAAQRQFAALLAGEEPYFQIEQRYRTQAGGWKWLAARGSVVERDAAGRPRRVAGTFQDIDDRKRAERLKDEFVSVVSHELRTPLTAIRGSLGLLDGGAAGVLPAEAAQMLQLALRNTERLARLINDILDSERIEAGKIVFDLRPVDLGSLIAQALEQNRPFAQQFDVRLEGRDLECAPFVQADPERLIQVLTNLISNAVKYSPSGQAVEVAVTVGGAKARVSVADRGPGIPEEFRARIFERFSQADATTTRKQAGSGLGLAISKAIVERMGGRIGFDSEPGVRTAFWFELPVVADLPKLSLPSSEGTLRGRRILVCEDDADVASLLHLVFEREGAVVDVCRSTAEARALLESQTYDALSLDLILPGEDGTQLFEDLRTNPRTRELPVVVVSGVADERRKVLNGGAVGVLDWIKKPIDTRRLIEAVRRAVRPDGRVGPWRVLYVEDEPELISLVVSLLNKTAAVVPAKTVAEARRLLKESAYDLLLLDVGLPDGSGLDLLGELPNTPNRAVPVLVFTANELTADRARQVNAALIKSKTSHEDLLATITRLLK